MEKMNQEEKELWYKEGLRFKCTGCGKCCTGSPGYVWLSEEDIARIASFLKISRPDFLKKYTRRIGQNISLLEDKISYDCVFLKEGRFCTVYEARPKQCSKFPWWKENVKTPEAWEEESERCEGINHPEAPLISLKEITAHLENS